MHAMHQRKKKKLKKLLKRNLILVTMATAAMAAMGKAPMAAMGKTPMGAMGMIATGALAMRPPPVLQKQYVTELMTCILVRLNFQTMEPIQLRRTMAMDTATTDIIVPLNKRNCVNQRIPRSNSNNQIVWMIGPMSLHLGSTV